MKQEGNRCPWCLSEALYIQYHDQEWGRPVHEDEKIFEFIILEGAQAGLSWITILRKRENYRKHFHSWNIKKIAQMTDADLEDILGDIGVVRNRLKIYSVRKNAKVALEIIEEFGSLDAYFWSDSWFYSSSQKGSRGGVSQKWIPHSVRIASEGHNDCVLKGFPLINHPKTLSEIPVETEISKMISKDLKKRGMSFVGSTIIYAFMQAIGLVDDHLETCCIKETSHFVNGSNSSKIAA